MYYWLGSVEQSTVSLTTGHHHAATNVRQTWICIAPRREHISKAIRCGTRSQRISHFFTCTPRVYQLTEWTTPVSGSAWNEQAKRQLNHFCLGCNF